MTDVYRNLKKAAGNGYYARRILAQLAYLQNVLEAEDGAVPAEVTAAMQTLLQQVQEEGAATKAAVLACEAALAGFSARAKSYKLICAAHAHIDMNWQWGTDETVGIVIDTFQTMLNLMEEYPEFTFSQSQAATYEIIERFCPVMLPDIRRHVKEGRWEVTASTWVEEDQNMSSTESILRHLLYTKQYLSQLLDIDPDSLNLDFEPDTFGHSAHIPALLQMGGVKYFYYCRGYDCKRAFRWQAPSGQEVLALCEPGWYHGAIEYEMTEFMPQWCKGNGLKTALKVYGVGDHGGGPTRRDIERIMDMSAWPLMPTITFGSIREFFRELEQHKQQLPVVNQELNFIFPGCYTSQSRIKQANRHGEDHLYDAEALSAMSMLAGGSCANPKGFSEAWQRVLFNQFHDILPGSCVREAREAALGTSQEAGAYAIGNANRAIRDLGQRIDTSLFGIQVDPDSTAEGGGVGCNTVKASRMERDYSATEFGFSVTSRGGGKLRAYTIFNPTQYDRRETVELTLWDWPLPLNETTVRDSCQNEVSFSSLQPRQEYWRHLYDKIALTADVPAFGYANYYVMEAETPRYEKPWDEPRELPRGDSGFVLENAHLRAVLSQTELKLISLIDKATGQQMLAGGAGFRLVQETEDWMSSWVVGDYAKITDLNEDCAVHVTQTNLEGELQWVRYEITFGASLLKVRVSLTRESKILRLSLETDFQELGGSGQVPQLQLYVPYAYAPKAIRCDVPGGFLDRPELAHDIPVIRYLCPVPETGSALVFTSDCKYGYRAWENAVIVDLLRASTIPDRYPEQGVHQIELGLAVSQNHGCDALSQIGTEFAHPLYPYSNSLHTGLLPQRASLLQVHGAEVLALKPGEVPQSVIMHLSNPTDVPAAAKLSRSARSTDILERALDDGDSDHIDLASGEYRILQLKQS